MTADVDHASIKDEISGFEQSLARGGNAAHVAQELVRFGRLAAASPDKLPLNLAVWGGLHDVVTKHRGAP